MNDPTISLTHIDPQGKAKMVDVAEKGISKRSAVAQSTIKFPDAVFQALHKNQFLSNKGSIMQTAIIAGIMAAKQTGNLIPLCHPLPVSNVQIDIAPEKNQLKILAQVKCEARTGVEMEALTAATIAALTIYDMCKALSHDIVISETKLMAKEGGKHVFKR